MPSHISCFIGKSVEDKRVRFASVFTFDTSEEGNRTKNKTFKILRQVVRGNVNVASQSTPLKVQSYSCDANGLPALGPIHLFSMKMRPKLFFSDKTFISMRWAYGVDEGSLYEMGDTKFTPFHSSRLTGGRLGLISVVKNIFKRYRIPYSKPHWSNVIPYAAWVGDILIFVDGNGRIIIMSDTRLLKRSSTRRFKKSQHQEEEEVCLLADLEEEM